MKKNKVISIVAVIVLVCVNLIFPINVFAEGEPQEKVTIEAVGFFTHYPMQSTLKAIQDTCAKFGDKVELKTYDEEKAEGLSFMEEKGLSGHIPMRLYINGSNTVTIDGKSVSFKDFVGYEWNAADLEKAITLALGGADIGTGDNPLENGINFPLIIGSLVVIMALALGGFFFMKHREKEAAKAKALEEAKAKALAKSKARRKT